MKLLACPGCARPYDVSNLAAGTKLRCSCTRVIEVRPGSAVAEAVVCGHCGAPREGEAAGCTYCGAALRALLCPRCGARVPEGARHCHSCAGELRCQALEPLRDGVDCPRCGGELRVRALERGSVIECGTCGGLWIGSRTFDDLCRRAADLGSVAPGSGTAPGATPTSPLAYIPCPTCGELMVRRQFRWRGRPAPVVLDHCRDHGVWLDGRELEAVLAFVRSPDAGPRPVSAGTSPAAATPAACPGKSLVGALLDLLTGDLF